jgi:hypothetical protein
MDSDISVGDVVQEKEGDKKNGLVVEIERKTLIKSPGLKKYFTGVRIHWPSGEKTLHNINFLEKIN